jgi:branched-chain amino acid transport system substrate-binding protein
MHIGVQGRAEPLDGGEGAALGVGDALTDRGATQPGEHAADERVEHGGGQRGVKGELIAQREGQRQHSLAHGDRGDDAIDQLGGQFAHAAASARGAEAPAFAAERQSAAQLEFALQQGAKRVAVISMRDAWGRARYNPLMETFKRKGVTPVADEEMSPDANDATPQVLRLRQANPDAVLIVLYPKAAAVYMRDAAKLGFKPMQVGQTALGDLIAFREQVAIPNALERFYTISHVRFTPDDPEMERWRGLLEKHFPGDRLSVYNIMGIASATVVVEVLTRAGRDLTRERVRDELNKLKDYNTGIYPGAISCTPADHQCHKTPAWMQLAGDKVKTIGVTPVTR